MGIYFVGDTHLGHNNIINYRKIFDTQTEHDTYILDMISKLHKKDILYVLGDFIFDCDKYDYYIEQFKKMPCRIKLVMGNHDSLRLYKEDRFEIQLPLFSYKNFWISHCPIHKQEMRGRIGNIHSHLHGEKVMKNILGYKVMDKEYINVNLDINKYKLISFDEIKEKINGK